MSSRSIEDLDTQTRLKAERFEILCRENDFPVLIYCTYRTFEEQAILYRQSRSLPDIKQMAKDLSNVYGRDDLSRILMDAGPQNGPHVTDAAPGQSLHNYRKAFDGVPMRQGKPVWGTSDPADLILWQKYGDLGRMAGLDWAGNWINFREYPHLQERNADWRLMI